jgi:hypothetical protein
MNESYQTPPSLIEAEQRLNAALKDLEENLDGVEELSGVASSFSEASEANKAVVAAFHEAATSYEDSSAATLATLNVLSKNIKDDQDKFSETLKEIRGELSHQSGKLNLIRILSLVPIVLMIGLITLSFLK